MNTKSILRAGLLAIALLAPLSITVPGLAQAADQSQLQNQSSNTGPYDGADYEAAKRAYY
jgi:hypothetical protein